jgi:flagellar hook-associated protein 2
MSVTIGGTFSGLNVSSIISTIIAADSVPITNLQDTDKSLQTQSDTLGTLGSSLGTLSEQLQALNSPSLFSSMIATGSNTAVGSATTDTTAKSGTVNINVTQLATTTTLTGGTAGGAFADAKLTAPPAGNTNIQTVLDETGVNGQTFTINGKQITLSSSDVLDDGNPSSTASVIGKINNSGAGVTASYDATTGKISLSSSSPIILGSGSDTSDFLQQAELFNNGGNSVTSSVGLGRIDPNTDLATAGLRTTPTAGTFTINGVSINYNAGDSLNTLISNINSSSAGVTAVYDTYEDQIVLSATQRGPQSITVADGTSNIGSALRLTSGDSSMNVGQSTLFTVGNNPTVRQSDSNVLSAGALGVPGVTFTATGTGATTVTVAPDVTTIANAIDAFINQYNTTQTLIAKLTTPNPSSSTSSSSSSSSTSDSGSLATDTNLTFLAPELRQMTSGSVSNTATIRMLSDLGIDTNANDNTLTQVDTTKLQAALTDEPSQVEALFNDPTSGLTTTVQTVLNSYNDSLNGVIVNEQNNIKTEVSYNQQQITRMQEQIANEQTVLEQEFAALDQIQASSQGLSGILSSSNGTTAPSSTSSSSSSSSSSGSSSIGSVGSSTTSASSTGT